MPALSTLILGVEKSIFRRPLKFCRSFRKRSGLICALYEVEGRKGASGRKSSSFRETHRNLPGISGVNFTNGRSIVFPTSPSATTGLEKAKVKLERRSTSPAGRISTSRILSPPKTSPLLKEKNAAPQSTRITRGKTSHKILCFLGSFFSLIV